MPNAWVEHVRKYAKDNGLSYGCAMSTPACKESYRKPNANYTKDLAKIEKLLREKKLQDAREAFNKVLPLIRNMAEGDLKKQHTETATALYKSILRGMAE